MLVCEQRVWTSPQIQIRAEDKSLTFITAPRAKERYGDSPAETALLEIPFL